MKGNIMSKHFKKVMYDSFFMKDDFAFSIFVDSKKARNKNLSYIGGSRFYFSTMENKNTVCNIFLIKEYKDRFMQLVAFGIALYNEEDIYDNSIGRKESFRKAINDLSEKYSGYEKDSEKTENFRSLAWKKYLAFEKKMK